jgi:hypothetical protein
MLERYNTHFKTTITAKQNVLLPTGVGKRQHLQIWFGKSPKWMRLQDFFRTFTTSLWQMLGCTGKT